MQNLLSTSRSLAALALAVAGFLGVAQAAPVVSINPATQDLDVGVQTTIEIVVSGLTQSAEAIGAFDITLDFDDSLLSGISFAFDPAGTMGLGDDFFAGGFAGGSVNLVYLADLLLSQDDLATAQGASFVLATVTFEGLANGLSPLTLSQVDLSDYNGDFLLQDANRNGSICVGGNCNTVPEPGTYGLAGVALLAAGWAGRARRRKQANV
jgi:uncharacterized protein (TIGR03382 family)